MTNIVYTVNEQSGAKTHSVFAQAVTSKTLTSHELITMAMKNTTYSVSEAEAIIKELADTIKDVCGMGLACQLGDGWISFYPVVNCSIKDTVDEHGNIIPATKDMLVPTKYNACAKIGCRVSCVYQKQFNTDVHYHKVGETDEI